jgi:outer membrane biosynthesis protein TonB
VSAPPPPSRRTERHDRAYRPRILAALAVSLGVLVLAFRFWPVEERVVKRPYVAEARERVPLELIEPTRQTPRAAPPPPPTLPPVEVPDDVPIPEEVLEFEVLETAPSTDIALPDTPPGPEMNGPDEAPPVYVARADRRPQTISPVLPTYPEEAERRGIRARVRLRLRIDERGRLQEVEITDRFLLDKRDREERVAEIGYGVEQAVLDAVNRTRFRPGRHEGRPVETYTTMTLSVGV